MSINLLIVGVLLGGFLFGKLFHRLGLPTVLGMTLWGVALGFFFKAQIPPLIWELAPFLKSAALITILLRAGLGIQKQTLAKVGKSALFMSFLPCIVEGTALLFLSRLLLSFTWLEAGMLGFMLSAVSPAVVVPSMLSLKEKGYGKKNEIPTLVLAGASLDDVFAITLFTLFLDLGKGANPDYLRSLLSIPSSLFLGILPGLLIGFLLVGFFKKYQEKIRATEKTLLILGISLLLIEVGEWFHAATLLGIMSLGFVLLEKYPPAARELSLKLNKAWVFAEIVLFVLIGMAVDVPVALKAGAAGLLLIALGLLSRSLGVFMALAFSRLNLREKFFCMIAYLPKATVQAALGAVPLSAGIGAGPTILAVAVLSIIVTAPLGLFGIKFFGPRLLKVDFDHKNPLEDSENFA